MMQRWRRWVRALALCCAGVSLLGSGGTFSEQDARVQLGRRLFYDADLSADGSMSCATCHEQRHAFADGNATHPGVTEEAGIRNVPSLGNVGSFTTLTWIDQHISRLETQFFVPVMGHTPVEMGMPDRATLVGRIADDTCYRKLFARGFAREGERITPQTIAQAVAAFERQLVSRNSRWDQQQRGEIKLNSQEQRGQKLFFGQGACSTCHAGLLFTDQKFHAFGTDAKTLIRTPSLRNVAVTAPYWHNGSAPTLHDAVVAHTGLSPLPPEDEAAVEAFLATLTDRTFLSNPALGLPPEKCPL